jgi:hypothetical protein
MPGSGDLRVKTDDGLVVVRQQGADVLVADGVPPDRVEAVFAAMVAGERRERGVAGPPPPGWAWPAFGGALLLLLVLAASRARRPVLAPC